MKKLIGLLALMALFSAPVQASTYCPVNSPTASISASNSSGRSAYKGWQTGTVILYNSGSVAVYVKSGDSTVVATTTDFLVAPGAVYTMSKNTTDTYLAAITASSTSTLYVTDCNGE